MPCSAEAYAGSGWVTIWLCSLTTKAKPFVSNRAGLDRTADVVQVAGQHANSNDFSRPFLDRQGNDKSWLAAGATNQNLEGLLAFLGPDDPGPIAVVLGLSVVAAGHIDAVQIGCADQVDVGMGLIHSLQVGLSVAWHPCRRCPAGGRSCCSDWMLRYSQVFRLVDRVRFALSSSVIAVLSIMSEARKPTNPTAATKSGMATTRVRMVRRGWRRPRWARRSEIICWKAA